MISSAKKLRVFQKDGFKCTECGSNKDLTVDHINPKSKGGSDDENNLRTLCEKCNKKKGNFNPSFKEKIFGFMVSKKELNDTKTTIYGTVKGSIDLSITEIQSKIQREAAAIHSKFDKKLNDSDVYQKKVDSAVVEVLSRFKALEQYLKIEYFEGKEYKKLKKLSAEN